MATASPSRANRFVDAIAGSLLLILGLVAAWQAAGFDPQSRPFPMMISGLLGLAGLVLILTAGLRPQGGHTDRRGHGGAVASAVAALVAWTLATGLGAGFLLPTFGLQVLLLWITGIRGIWRLLITATAVTAFAYLLFVVALDIPMPPSRLPDPLQGF